MNSLLFVYNADSGKFNALTDSLHKLISPDTYDCRLCELTHGFFKEKTEWKKFISEIGVETKFFHRDEFLTEFPQFSELLFPAVFIKAGDSLREAVSSDDFKKVETLKELCDKLKSIL